MSPGKLAAQSVHAAIGLGSVDYNTNVVVLGLSDKKFDEMKEDLICFVVKDAGHTEVAPGTETCLAYHGS